MILPHTTTHKIAIGTFTQTAKLKVVSRNGLNIEPSVMEAADMYKVAKGLVNYAATEGVPVNGYALWITSENDKVMVNGKEQPAPIGAKKAQALIVKAEKANLPITIEDTHSVGRDGQTYANRFAGRIKIGESTKKATAATPPSAAVNAFLQGWG